MKIADLLLKKEKKIERQKRLIKNLAAENKTLQLNMGDVGELIDKMSALRAENSSLQKEYAEFVQSAGDKIQELKKCNLKLNEHETMLMYYAESPQFTIDEIEYCKPVQPTPNPITNPNKVKQYPYQKIIVKITNHGEPIL